jgi:hypothetical protein
MWALLLRPVEFYRTLPNHIDARHWVFVALLIFILAGLSTVQRQALLSAPSDSSTILLNWNMALISASTFIMGWIVQAVLLSLVSLLSGRAPRLGLNLQIAIWASLPLGLMAGLQLLYYSAGGPIGADGVSGLVGELPGYENLPALAQTVVTAAAAQVTIFWAWNLLLLYLGGRFALDGGWLAAALVVLVWALLLIFTPVGIQFASG